MPLTATNIWVQLISTTVGSLGFAIIFRMKGKQLAYAGIGAFCTWAVYLAVFMNNSSSYSTNNFISTFAGAVFVAGYSQIMARINKAPATIFLASTAFPLIPGANLYYMMYSFVMGYGKMAKANGFLMIETCLAIALGFIVIEVVNKYAVLIWACIKKLKRKKRSGSRSN